MHDNNSTSDLSEVKPYSFQSGDSSMDEGDGLLTNGRYHPEMGQKSPYQTRQQRRWLEKRKLLWLLNAVIFITGVCAWGYTFVRSKGMHCKPANDFEPDLQFTSRVTFQPHHYYGGPPSNETNEMWRRLSPPGNGIISLPKDQATHLHPTLPHPRDPNMVIYGISMFHQLHCLNFLRMAYWPDSMMMDMTPDEVVLHRDHCLDYIRQAIMCNGDVTFEPTNHIGVDGMGATHQCRDFDVLFSWAYEHRSNKDVGGAGYVPERHQTPEKENSFED